MSVVGTAKIIKGLTDDKHLKAAVLGWGIELMRPTFCIFLFFRSHPSIHSSKPYSSRTAWWIHRSRAEALLVPRPQKSAKSSSTTRPCSKPRYMTFSRSISAGRATMLIFLETTFQTEMAAYRFDYCSGGRS